MKSMVTINDVAKKCGVAKSTVSNALTDKKYVSPELKKRIMDACEELDFQPNFYASTLSRGNTNIIALILEEDSGVKYRRFYTDLITSCLKTAAAAGRHLLVYNGLDKQSVVTMLKRNKAPIDGAIVLTPLVDDFRLAQMEKQRIPCVIIGRPDKESDISYVDVNNVRMVADVTKRLYEQGYRRFCLVNSERSKTISLDRAKGFCETLSAYADADIHVVYTDESSEGEGRRACMPYLQKEMAFITSDGTIARGVYKTALEAGMTGKDGIKIYSLGEDDEGGDVLWEYARQDYSKLGETATSILLKEIDGEKEIRKLCTDYYVV